MDRNINFYPASLFDLVALRKESVDRNNTVQIVIVKMNTSLSARRAWIEIGSNESSEDANNGSLSARRAWIEIRRRTYQQGEELTSLSARRAWIEIIVCAATPTARIGRSPQGERG